jgi:hypothetical protein
MKARLAVLSLTVPVWCCVGEHGAPAGDAMRDSAGITIVENAAPLWQPGESWRLSDEPVVRVGAVEGDPEYLLLGVRSALRLDDGTIVISNSGTEEIRFFDSQGRYLRTTGGKGGGPGEFSNLIWIYPLGDDSIVAWDDSPPGIAFFDREGRFGHSARPEPPGVLRGVFADGSLLFAEHVLWSGPREGRQRPPARAYRLDRDGAVIDSLPVFPGREFHFQVRGREGYGSISLSPPPFGRFTAFAVSGDGFYAGSQDEFELTYYDLHGRLTTLVRWPARERRVTPGHVERYVQYQLDELSNQSYRSQVERSLSERTYPELLPAYGAIAVDGEGNLWVEEYHLDWENTRSWLVFDAERRLLGTVVMPGDFIVHQIGRDFVLGWTWDDLDVEYIELYELLRP